MDKRVYSVGQVCRYIRNLFTRDGFLAGVSVSGEVSNCKYHSSGHIYFSLKDSKSAIACVMFAGSRKGLKFPMKDGDKVVVSGSVDFYERDGRCQLYATSVRLEGMGDLYEKFLALKQELEEEGLFDPAYKKPIPAYARRIGIVTAPTGAAIHDIQTISRRRNPYVQLILCPSLVQGDGAPESIVRGIRMLDEYGVDVIIAGRGGGSYEDLQAFNDESVARAIFACGTPVISAVGHETDTTIADFAADLRAPTPSAAAELAVFDYRKFSERIGNSGRYLARGLRVRLERAGSRCRSYEERLKALSPAGKLLRERHEEAELLRRFDDTMSEKLRRNSLIAEEYWRRLRECENGVFASYRKRQMLLIGRMKGLNPLDRLRQGYSYVEVSGGRALRSVGQVKKGEAVRIYVTDGTIEAEVRDKDERKPEE